LKPDPLVLVDARNVLRSRWPNIPEDEVVDRCAEWARRQAVRAAIVFDGRAPGGLVGERELDERCRLVGTGDESADDWLIREAAELRSRQEPFWLVTSDRALRAAAAGPERVIGGGAFAGDLLSL
jgi:predicted RNA-binding protein with PIN domain